MHASSAQNRKLLPLTAIKITAIGTHTESKTGLLRASIIWLLIPKNNAPPRCTLSSQFLPSGAAPTNIIPAIVRKARTFVFSLQWSIIGIIVRKPTANIIAVNIHSCGNMKTVCDILPGTPYERIYQPRYAHMMTVAISVPIIVLQLQSRPRSPQNPSLPIPH